MFSEPDIHSRDHVHGRLNRRELLKRGVALSLSIPVVSGLLIACGGDDDDDDTTPVANTPAASGGTTPAAGAGTTPAAEATMAPAGETPAASGGEDGEPQRGGKITIATISQPPSLDIHQTTGRGVLMSMSHVYETLFTWDAEYAISMLLAETYEASDDSLSHTIALRKGVPFHNGDEMTAADVIATLDRWKELSPLGKSLYAKVDEVVEVDSHTLEIKLTDPLGSVPQLLARGGQGAYIYPKAVVEAAGVDFVDEYIGTGPYSFVELQADRFMLLKRFEDYVGPTGTPSGYAGSKAANLDEIEFIPVPDEAARVAGFQAGDYHYLEEVIADQIETLQSDENLVVEMLPVRSYGYIGLNHKSELMGNLKIRQAMQAALNVEPMGQASHGDGFFTLGAGIMLPITVWDSEAGAELYNQNDPEKAKALLEEAGYDGTPINWLTTQEDLGDYNSAVVCQQQLEAAGFTVELTVVDEATVFSTRSEETGWDVWNGAFILRTDPSLLPFLATCDYSGWWCSDEKEAAAETMLASSDFEERYEAFETLQRLFYEEVGGLKQQDNFGIMTKSAKLKNFSSSTTLFQLEPEFNNAWLEQ